MTTTFGAKRLPNTPDGAYQFAETPEEAADGTRIDQGCDATDLVEKHDPVERAELEAVLLLLGFAARQIEMQNYSAARRAVLAAHRRTARLHEINLVEDAAHTRMRERVRSYEWQFVARDAAP